MKLVMKTLWQLLMRKKISRTKKRMMNTQRSNSEKINLIEGSKKNRH